MPPSTEDRLRDILEAIQAIEHMLGGADLEQFTSDTMRRMAIERYLEIVCEAAHRLTDEVKREAPQIDWCGWSISVTVSIMRIMRPMSGLSGRPFRITCPP
jgi:uncharacterized protein with HEPN domain